MNALNGFTNHTAAYCCIIWVNQSIKMEILWFLFILSAQQLPTVGQVVTGRKNSLSNHENTKYSLSISPLCIFTWRLRVCASSTRHVPSCYTPGTRPPCIFVYLYLWALFLLFHILLPYPPHFTPPENFSPETCLVPTINKLKLQLLFVFITF